MLLPLGLLSFTTALRLWCVFNVLAAFASILLVRHILQLNNTQTLWTALLFLSCTPLRVVLANGQASMLYLLLALAAHRHAFQRQQRPLARAQLVQVQLCAGLLLHLALSAALGRAGLRHDPRRSSASSPCMSWCTHPGC